MAFVALVPGIASLAAPIMGGLGTMASALPMVGGSLGSLLGAGGVGGLAGGLGALGSGAGLGAGMSSLMGSLGGGAGGGLLGSLGQLPLVGGLLGGGGPGGAGGLASLFGGGGGGGGAGGGGFGGLLGNLFGGAGGTPGIGGAGGGGLPGPLGGLLGMPQQLLGGAMNFLDPLVKGIGGPLNAMSQIGNIIDPVGQSYGQGIAGGAGGAGGNSAADVAKATIPNLMMTGGGAANPVNSIGNLNFAAPLAAAAGGPIGAALLQIPGLGEKIMGKKGKEWADEKVDESIKSIKNFGDSLMDSFGGRLTSMAATPATATGDDDDLGAYADPWVTSSPDPAGGHYGQGFGKGYTPPNP